jgi:alpha-1,3-mannosyltransferase
MIGALDARRNHHCPVSHNKNDDDFDDAWMEKMKKRYGKTMNGKRLYFAMNFCNNEAILPEFIGQFERLLRLLHSFQEVSLMQSLWSHQRQLYFVSIYESGSNDQTQAWLEFFDQRLHMIFPSVGRDIRWNGELVRKPSDHRIEFLASVRNEAMRTLYNTMTSSTFDRIVFMNDVIYCAEDVLELLLHSFVNDAHMTCGMDYQMNGGVAFYDDWVMRDRTGKYLSVLPLNSHFTSDVEMNTRMEADMAVQVQCCWNGMAVLSTAPFIDGIRFRREVSVILEDGDWPKYSACSGSEISVFCNDMNRRNFSRALVVPNVRFAYDHGVYDNLKNVFAQPQYEAKGDQVERYAFKEVSNSIDCWPMDSVTERAPDGKFGNLILTPK